MAAKASASGTKRSAAASSSSGSGSQAKKVKPNSSSSSTKATEDGSIPLGKALASTEKSVRDGAVRSLHAYLSTNGAHTIPELELKKLWKGLFYCFWMSDKPLIQQRLANDLADLVLVHPTTTSSTDKGDGEGGERVQAGLKFLECFWDTLVEEWAGLDKHRIDKYYLLVRRFVGAGFRLLAEHNWPQQATQELARILGKFPGGVLGTNDPKVPDSLTYHLCDIYLDELEKVIESHQEETNANLDAEDPEAEAEDTEDELPLVPTLDLLMPFVDALATAKSKPMYDRIWSNVFEPLLQDTLRASARHDEFDDDDQQQHQGDAQDENEADGDSGDETANGTEFHSFADESVLTAQAADDGESEPSIPDSELQDSDEDEDEDDDKDDVRYPLLLALSAVPTPTGKDGELLEEIDEDQADVALVLRKAIFQALFKAASRKDATEARRRLLYQLWRDEQDRLNEEVNDDDE